MNRRAWALPVFAALVSWPGQARGFGLEDYLVKIGTRYDRIAFEGRENRIQSEVRTGFSLDTFWDVKLKATIATGDTYTSRYTTVWDFREEEADFRLYFRNLYLEKTHDRFRFQLGTIPPIKNIVSSTGLRDLGWIDGGRAEYRYGSGVIEVVLGMLTELDNPSTFTRRKGVNYFEAELSQSINPFLGFELSSEHLDGQSYARGELRVDIPVLPDRHIDVATELLFNYTTPSIAAAATVDLDVLHLATGMLRKRLELSAAYSYLDPDIGPRGELTEDFYTYGHTLTLEMDGLLVEQAGLKWFYKTIIAERPRFQVGLSMRFEGRP